MKHEDKKRQKNNARKKSAPKLRCFTSPFENGSSTVSNDVFFDSIGNDIFMSDCDPNGSYTGITRDGDNRPVQDADDL